MFSTTPDLDAISETPEPKPEYTKGVSEDLLPVPSRRFMVFVPEVIPHFVLVCLENIGWSVRDYSSGQVRLLSTQALGRPIEQLVAGPAGNGCLAFKAPRVSIFNQNFWKCLTDELGERFLGVAPAKLEEAAGHLYPVIDEPEFEKATPHLTAFERVQILRSARSPDWTTWNAMQLLMTARPVGWWNDLGRQAAYMNPANRFADCVAAPTVEFWKSVIPSEAYDKWLRSQMSHGPRNIRKKLWGMDLKPLESPTRVDLCFDGGDWMVFAESRIRRNSSMRTPLDSRRNRLIQLADCLVTAAKGRPCALWILARDVSPDRDYVELVERYRASPEMFAAELPYHPAETLYQLAQRLTVLRWSDVAGSLVGRKNVDDPVVAGVRKELFRRVHGAAAMAAGAK